MAITTLSTMTITQLKSALSSTGKLGTVSYEDSTNLICSLVGFSKVWKFVLSTSVFDIYWGDAWTSGTTITNQKTTNRAYQACSAVDVITTSKAIGFFARDTTFPFNLSTVIAKTTNASPKDIVISFGATNSVAANRAWCWDLSTGLEVVPSTSLVVPIKNGSGFYYAFDLYVKEVGTGNFITDALDGVKLLGKATDLSGSTVGRFGNDAVLVANYTSNASVPVAGSILVVNGNV